MATSAIMMPMLQRLGRSRFWSHFREMRRADVRSDPAHNTGQLIKLSRTLRHAVSHVPRWQERAAEQGISSDDTDPQAVKQTYRSVGILSKQHLREGFPDKVTASGSKEQWRFGSSAGTVDRVSVVSDFHKRDFIRATNLRVIDTVVGDALKGRIVEIPPDACNVVCALRDEGPLELLPFVGWALKKRILFKRETRPDLRGRVERTFIIRQDTLEPLEIKPYSSLLSQLDEQLDRIRQVRPNIVRGLPLFLLWLAERARERELTFPSLKVVMPYGGLMSLQMAKRVEQGFGVPFVDYYGTSEVGGVAIQRDNQIGLDVFDDLFLVEIVDQQGNALPPGKPGRVLITDYNNFAMPIIRYEIGDWGKWHYHDAHETDPFVLSAKGRLEILGRRPEMTRVPSGNWISSREVMDVLFSDPAILNVSVEQRKTDARDSRDFVVRIAEKPNQKMDPSTTTSLQALLELENTPRIKTVNYLRPESSGKYQLFKPLSS